MRTEDQTFALRVLLATDWLDGFNPAMAGELLRQGRLIRIGKGEWAQGEGDRDRGLFVVIDGLFHTYCTAPGDRDVMIGQAGTGSVLGHTTRFSGGPRLATAICIEPAMLLQVPETALERVAESYPEIWRVIANSAYANLRKAMQMMIETIALSPRQRIAARLTANLDLTEPAPITVKLSQQMLGEMTGLTRKTINGHLRAFEREGLLVTGYGEMQILDPAGLRTVAHDHGT